MNTRTLFVTLVVIVLAATGCAGNVNDAVSRSITATLDRHQRLAEDGNIPDAVVVLNGAMDQMRMACAISNEACRAACGRAGDVSSTFQQWNLSHIRRSSQDPIARYRLVWDLDVRTMCIAVGTPPTNMHDRGVTLLGD